MSNKVLSLNYYKCDPEQCNNGYCLAVQACPLKIIEQEERFAYPFAGSSICKGCAKCTNACPMEAISLT